MVQRSIGQHGAQCNLARSDSPGQAGSPPAGIRAALSAAPDSPERVPPPGSSCNIRALSRYPGTSPQRAYPGVSCVRATFAPHLRLSHPPPDETRPSPFTARILPCKSALPAVTSGSSPGTAAGAPSPATRSHSRAAYGTGIRLGVKPAVKRVIELGPAVRAHLEPFHRSQGAVVGNVADNREARTAVGAIDERIAVAAVSGSHASRRDSPRRQRCPVRPAHCVDSRPHSRGWKIPPRPRAGHTDAKLSRSARSAAHPCEAGG